VAITPPYMHNGMFKTLHEVIDFYNNPAKVVPNAINRDPSLSKPLNLSHQDEIDIENFLLTLTDKRFLNKS
ncbi:MAG: cytochrome-c peroxidase, partial [Ginsengibacter sp.]